MIKQTLLALSAFALVSTLLAPAPANAQGVMQSQARTGSFGNASRKTNNARRSNSMFTSNQGIGRLQVAGLGGVAQIHGPTGRNGLPQTSLDSFVLNAGGSAEQIYGDEGSDGPPPYEEFTAGHRIERGIQGARAAGLTTGHGSTMPAAWGGDEFCKGTEWTRSGSSGGGNYWSNPAPGSPDGQRGDLDGTDPVNYDDPSATATNQNDPNGSGF